MEPVSLADSSNCFREHPTVAVIPYGRGRRRRLPRREEPLGRVSTGKGSDAPTSQTTKGGSAVGNSISRSGDVEAPSPSKSSAIGIGKNGASKKKHKKDKKSKKEKKSKKSKTSKEADKGRRSGGDEEGSPSPRRYEHGRRKHPAVATADSGPPKPSERRTRSDDFTSAPAAAKSSKPPKSSKSLSAVPSAATTSSSSTPSTSSAGKEKKASTGKKSKRQAVPASLLSFEDEGKDGGGAEFQGLGAATLNEFKRSHKKSQTESVAATAAAAAAATAVASAGDSTEEALPVTARLGLLLEKKRDAELGPSKISTAESRGEREYQEDRHTVVQCLHAPDDAHTKFDACPPCFFAVFDGHNGDLAADIARSKLHTYVAKAAPTTGLRGEPTERLEGLLRAGFASTEAEILKETEETKDDDEDDGTGGGNGNSRQDGTTVTACLLVGNFLVTANVGDSRAVLGSVGHEGKLRCKNISVDHKPEDPHEKRRIKAAGGEVVFNGCYRVQHENVSCRLAVSRSLGDRQFKGQGGQPPGSQVPPPPDMHGQLVSPEPSVKSVKLEQHDRVVIVASGKDFGQDGLWDVMTGLEAVEIAIAAHGKAPTTTGRAPSWANALVNGVGGGNAEADPANALVREAVKRGTSDNVTAVVTILSWD
ncbi:protein phosphatase 2C (ISS) [Ectocarpus siliculosus]|uniref:Protein phosphatase 2C (ISS) n=1 Tax=Ectocarpus siliculosus TaxID=2880 RepID=D7G6W0_ECTSI|nr:protein phosphatase 2C (ISS) [Ectocarpus siliculosus]|eukprot:CBJ25653.1 protein phosphatase 2C (ISS) [Ectocarpus siliculosus]